MFLSILNEVILEDRPVYPKTECFDPFPFPDPSEAQRQHIRTLSESLDEHRKRQQGLHPQANRHVQRTRKTSLGAGSRVNRTEHSRASPCIRTARYS